MPKRILIRPGQDGKWFGYASPMPKMPHKDNIREWKDFEAMVAGLKQLKIKVIVTSDEMIARFAKYGVEAIKLGEKP